MKDCLTGIAAVHRGQVGHYFLSSVYFHFFQSFTSLPVLHSHLPFNFLFLPLFSHFWLYPPFRVVSPLLPPSLPRSRSECRGQWRSLMYRYCGNTAHRRGSHQHLLQKIKVISKQCWSTSQLIIYWDEQWNGWSGVICVIVRLGCEIHHLCFSM